MKIIIAGGTGLIGSKLAEILSSNGYIVYILTRHPNNYTSTKSIQYIFWDGKSSENILDIINDALAVINLSGETISKRWTEKQIKKIKSSRLDSTQAIIDAISKANKKPKILMNASAVGYYGDTKDKLVDEEGKNGTGFLAELCNRWEGLALQAEKYGVNVVLLRNGIILDKNKGAFPKIIFTFKFYVGVIFGDGLQWLSWIHIDDAVNAIMFLLTSNIQGTVNLVAPENIRYVDLIKTIGAFFKSKIIFKVNSNVLNFILGKMSKELFLYSQRVYPKKLLESGFNFKYPNIKQAVSNLLD